MSALSQALALLASPVTAPRSEYQNRSVSVSRILGNLPNTYAYTKALAEHLVVEQMDSLPVVIMRPSIGEMLRQPEKTFILNKFTAEFLFSKFIS